MCGAHTHTHTHTNTCTHKHTLMLTLTLTPSLQDVSHLVWSMARSGHRPPRSWLHGMCVDAHAALPGFRPQVRACRPCGACERAGRGRVGCGRVRVWQCVDVGVGLGV